MKSTIISPILLIALATANPFSEKYGSSLLVERGACGTDSSKPGYAGYICDGDSSVCQPPTVCNFAGCVPVAEGEVVCPPYVCGCP